MNFDASALPPGFDGQVPARINIKEHSELSYWVRTLGVSEAQLRHAVAAVGEQVDEVRNHFGALRTLP